MPLLALLFWVGDAPVQAQAVIERVHARGVVRCGSVARPGLAQEGGPGQWSGVLVDICRAIATAALGAPDRMVFGGYVSEADFDRVRQGGDDVYFLTGAEINAHVLAGLVLPGPNVYIARNAVMVPGAAREQHLGELAGGGICYLAGESAERSLEAWFDERHRTWLRHAYSEDGEMVDAYAAQRCHAIAGESTRLALQRRDRGAAGLASRILPEPLNTFPIIAATATQDGRWAAIVAWTVNTLINGQRPDAKWYAGGARAMPLAAPELGLAPGWQELVLSATGNYGAIYARHLGTGTPLHLERVVDDADPADGALLLPYVE
jgi:general L-amino acid transport system substrate-binding protein